jgi:HK97 family phage portal protein
MEVKEDEAGKEFDWDIDMRTTLWTVEAWLCLKAAAYVLKRGNRAGLQGLQVLNANSMRVKEYDNDGPTVFEQRVGTQTKLYKPEEMVYFRTFDPRDDIHEGVAAGQVGLRSGSLVKAANEWAAAFFSNGAIPAVFLTTEGAVPPVEKDRIQTRWEKMLKGVQRAFKTTVLERGLKPTVIGMPIKELAMPELDRSQREQILAAHGIPPGLAEAKTNRAERDSLQYEFWTHCIIPEEEVWIEPVLNEQLFNPLGLRISFQHKEIEAIQREEIKKAESLAFAITGAILPAYQANTVNVSEVRSWIDAVGKSAGLPPLEENFEPEERVAPQPFGGPAQEGPSTSAENVENRSRPKAQAPVWGHHRISLPS